MIIGFKAFKSDLKNKYGVKFELGKIYSKNPDTLRFGENGHGYHMTSKLADTFRFFNPTLDNVYCEVVGFGKIVEQDNYLYDSAPMYVVEKFKVIRVLSREDIFNYIYQSDIDEFRRCLALYPLTKEELKILREKVISRDNTYKEILMSAMKSQRGDIDTFKRNKKYLRRGV